MPENIYNNRRLVNKPMIAILGLLTSLVLSVTGSARADKKVYMVPAPLVQDTIYYNLKDSPYYKDVEDKENIRESFFNQSNSLDTSHFTWGAEIGSSLDMTSHDLSTFDGDVMIGYKNSFMKFAGIGAGIHRSIHTGNNFIPVYGLIRTSFRSKPSLLFMSLQAGYSFNTISKHNTVGDFTGSIGLGVNLQQSKACKTYIVLALAYQYFSEDNKSKIDEIDTNYIYFARLSLGINF
ncbi:MAG: hypothetical protein HDS71_09705 [Bacteroidales bacterium]|nr:hypothetical protein [Bacteroidales bacterium]MBD5206395.1 hypothetical protein [Bacteroidales bacterium]MBD5224298.1 hypothetical protein [Bacteroidales bacterium]